MSDEAPCPLLRPSVPPLVWFALGVWVGACAAEALSWARYVSGALAVAGAPARGGVVLGWIACAVGAALFRRRAPVVALVLAGAVAGGACGQLYWQHWDADVRALGEATSRRWVAQAIADPKTGTFGARSLVRMSGSGPAAGSLVSCGWQKGFTPPEAGQRVKFYAAARPPGADERGRRAHMAGQCGSVSARAAKMLGQAPSLRGVVGRWRNGAVAKVHGVPGPGGDLLAGVVLGDRRRLDGTEADADFRTCGLTHLVAVSGGHLVVVAAIVTWLACRARMRPWAVAVAVSASLGLYVVASGVQASAVRAWLMAVLVSFTVSGGRRADGLSALGAAAAVAVALWPPVAFDLGFRLSVLAVGGLLLFARFAEGWVVMSLPRAFGWASTPLAMTLVAQAATAPLTIATFHTMSLVAPVANVVAEPLVSLALALGLAGLGAAEVWPALGRALLLVAGAFAAMCVSASGWLADRPYAAVPLGGSARGALVVALAAAGALWVAWPAPRIREARLLGVVALAACVAVALGPPSTRGPNLLMLDVGQGDALLLRDGAHAVLVDTGPDSATLRDALARAGVRRLERVVITHLHADHAGGLAGLQGVVGVGAVSFAAGALATPETAARDARRLTARLTELRTGDRFAVGGWTVRVVSPDRAVSDASENDSSVVLLASAGATDVLLTGDAEAAVLDRVTTQRLVGDIEVLKVGHHGSANAASDQDLRVLRPELALVSVGKGNRYGHPVQATLDLLSAAGARVVRSDESGDVLVRALPGGGIAVSSRQTRRDATQFAPRLRAYAKLVRTLQRDREAPPPYERQDRRPQARLPHRERAALAGRSGRRAAQEARGRDRGPRLQLRYLRCGLGRPRCRHRRLQHVAIRVRPPPRDPQER